ncbi:MAG TPA: class I SAM-dependent methyltransferase [Azoarcus taiwanensis]|nr:class I SAM-dependent methyltransferase [Azoarcus taiwanensis]
MNCRHCQAPLHHVFLDLGFAPPSNAYLSDADLRRPETSFPLKLFVCDHCWLVQTEDYVASDELFRADYAYFSSTSATWLQHARDYSGMIRQRLGLTPESFVIEVAANDGYLLKNFIEAGIPCVGIEPTEATAIAAESQGIPIIRSFFSEQLARTMLSGSSGDQGGQTPMLSQADLIVGNNVFAHVPDINDFTRALKLALKPGGTITLEFPHLLNLICEGQFDTVYHEHFSYLSLTAVQRIFGRHGLRILEVEQLPTHGGSLRVYGAHADDLRPADDSVTRTLRQELSAGLLDLATYGRFQARADSIKNDLLLYLIECKRAGRRIVGYGAAAKGNTLLNYAGVRPDLLPYVCDAAPAKQGKYLPGSHIPIRPPQTLRDDPPDEILILPWNLAGELRGQLGDLVDIGVRLVTAIPRIRVI